MRLSAALISLGSTSSRWLAKAMKKYFDEVDEYDLKNIEINLGKETSVLYKGKEIKEHDCIYAKGSFRYSLPLRGLTSILYKKCYMPITSIAFTFGHDKLLTQLRLDQKGVPMPRTYLASSPKAAREILGKVNYPIIMKFPRGTQGKGVMFADSFASASSLMDALTALKQPFLIQEYIDTGGIDIRAVVIGNEVIAMKRRAVRGEARANIHAGAKGRALSLDDETKKIAVNAARAIGADICAVDILESAKGPLVIEVNLSPGLQGITEAAQLDVADKIAKLLYENTKTIKSAEKDKGSAEIINIMEEKEEIEKEILTNLNFRGDRIMLPELASKISRLKEGDEIALKLKKGKISIEKI